ncbi:MAG: 50S ribosomal protein L25 [Planctomycetaceae bacterium]|jgi:large subunit ribosomal protein L25|nr:50S ribosomal protein L25 [Planctomycetaceae bacterium]|tara:strand:+ start:346 stop:960 length:615 start_codon:yes stop_codon:yes gene_type:complete
MSDLLEVTARSVTGTKACRKMRQEGHVPAILYGHGETCVDLVVRRDAVEAMVRHGSKTVELTGAVKSPALVRELQWNTFGTIPLHIDFLRIDPSEKIKVVVPVEFRGESPGAKAGGKLKQTLRELEVECTAQTMPEVAVAHLAHLEAGNVLKIKHLELPEGVYATSGKETVVASCLLSGQKLEDASDIHAEEVESTEVVESNNE